MSILDDITKPLKSLVNGLEQPIEVVEKIFGEVIKITKEIIESLLAMIKEIEDLFNESEIETIFLAPFKNAGLLVINSVEKLLSIMKPFAPVANDYKDEILEPIESAYSLMRDSLTKAKNEAKIFMQQIDSDSLDTISGTRSRFDAFLVKLESLPTSVNAIRNKLRDNFKVETGKIFEIDQTFYASVRNEKISTEKKVSQSINTNIESFNNVKEKINSRLENENAALDALYIVLFLIAIGMIAAVYYLTQSLLPIVILFVILAFAFIIYILVEVILKPIIGV